jgi:uncharacterized protein with PQ loop repeat
MLGWIGSLLLGICALPETIRTIKDNRCHVGWGMLLLWYSGELFVFFHVFFNIHDLALLTNYLLNIILITIMLIYKIKK